MDNKDNDCSPGSSERCLDKQNKEENNSADYTNEINKSVASNSVVEGTQDSKDQAEADIENQGDTLRQMPDNKADIQNKDSPDNGPDISTNQENDLCDETQYSHAVHVDGVRISMPGRGNLKIFDVNNTESEKPRHNDASVVSMEDVSEAPNADKEDEFNEIPNADKEDEVSGPPNAGREDTRHNLEKEEALAVLRKGQTYDEEEDYIDYNEYYENFEKAQEKFVFFWKSHNIYSQWHHSGFTVNGRKFFNAEQYMMFKKADLFGDEEIAKQILKSKDPRKIKALGRQVKGFNQDIWQQHCLYIVKEGNMAKFLQKDSYLADILFTYPKVLVEASPLDRIWGIGLAEENPDAWDESTWQGTNYLGYVLTEVRDDIMVERGMIDDQDRVRYIDNMLAGFDVPAATADQYRHIGEGAGRQGDERHDKDENTDPDKNMGSHDNNKESYHLFDSGFFSQFYSTKFMVDDIEFSSTEQYMMYKKAKLFNDTDTAKEIMNKKEPGKIKHLGRQVKGFNEEIWRKNALNIVKEGNKAKFSQDEKLKKAIVTTYPKVFVEAKPDRLWGIGLKIKDPKATKRHTWQGKNFLGYVLTEVRDELMHEWGLLKKERVSKYIEKLQNNWIADATKNIPGANFTEADQTYHSKEKSLDDWWEKGKQNGAVNNDYRKTTEDTRKGRQARKTDHIPGHVDYKEHRYDNRDRRNDYRKHGDEHQKHDDWIKVDHKKSNYQKRSTGDQQHGDNFKKHINKDGDNMGSKGNRKQQGRSHSPLRDESVAHKAERQPPVVDVNVSQGEKIGKPPATHTNKDSKQIEEKVKPKEVTKSGKSSNKGSKGVEKQENIVDDFDMSVVLDSISKNDQAMGKVPQSPTNKTDKKKKEQRNIDTSEEVHNPSTNGDEGTSARKPSRRQKKNARKKQS